MEVSGAIKIEWLLLEASPVPIVLGNGENCLEIVWGEHSTPTNPSGSPHLGQLFSKGEDMRRRCTRAEAILRACLPFAEPQGTEKYGLVFKWGWLNSSTRWLSHDF